MSVHAGKHMPVRNRLSLPLLIGLTAGPALIVGAGLWLLADLMPGCDADIRESVNAPDGAMALTVFGLDCGATTGFNTQAAIHPAADPFTASEALTFFAADGLHALHPEWTAEGIALTLPADDQVLRRADSVGGVPVRYR